MPATEQLNIRVTPAVKERFRKRALREGLSQAQLLEALLTLRGALPVPETSPPAPVNGDGQAAGGGEPSEAPAATIDFATWLSGRISTPRALVARAIRGGRVTVGGVPWTAERIDEQARALPMTYEGRPV